MHDESTDCEIGPKNFKRTGITLGRFYASTSASCTENVES